LGLVGDHVWEYEVDGEEVKGTGQVQEAMKSEFTSMRMIILETTP
jgi:hypothetical protein